MTLLSQVYVGEELEAAREEAKPHLTFLYERLFAGVHIGAQAQTMGDDYYDPERHQEYVDAMPPYAQSCVDYDYESAVESGTSIVGDPEHVVSRIEEIYEVVGGFATFIGQFHFGTMPDDLLRGNLRRYAESVALEIESLGGDGLAHAVRR